MRIERDPLHMTLAGASTMAGASVFRTSGPTLDRTACVARASLDVSLGENGSVTLVMAERSRRITPSTRAI